MNIYCMQCESANAEDAPFCGTCGNPLRHIDKPADDTEERERTPAHRFDRSRVKENLKAIADSPMARNLKGVRRIVFKLAERTKVPVGYRAPVYLGLSFIGFVFRWIGLLFFAACLARWIYMRVFGVVELLMGLAIALAILGIGQMFDCVRDIAVNSYLTVAAIEEGAAGQAGGRSA